MDPAPRARLVRGLGIEGNADRNVRRQVTMIAAETWEAIQNALGVALDPAARRANLLLRGIALRESRGGVLRVGSCRLLVHGELRPCERMEEAHPGLEAALQPPWRGGAYAEVLDGGEIRVGDTVRWEGTVPLPHRVRKSDQDWQAQLSPEQYAVTRRRGTEVPWSGASLEDERPGIYCCVCCGNPLFSSAAKFDARTGWPSFSAPFAPSRVLTREDPSDGTVRAEVLCAVCDAHLGYVFPDGPLPTGLRYSMNAAALRFDASIPA